MKVSKELSKIEEVAKFDMGIMNDSRSLVETIKSIIHELEGNKELQEQERIGLCELMLEDLSYRINLVEEFYESSYVVNGFSNQEEINDFYKKIIKLEIIKEDEKINEVIDELKQIYMRDIAIIVSRVIEKYILSIDEAVDMFRYSNHTLYKTCGKIYHKMVKDYIKDLIDAYNSIINMLDKKGVLIKAPIIINRYDDSEVEVFYFNDVDKRNKLNKICRQIIENQSPRVLEIFCNNKDFEWCSQEKLGLEEYCVFVKSGEVLGEDNIFLLLESVFEGFNKEGRDFAAQIRTNHIIFIIPISASLRDKLIELKNRGNIKYYFFMKCAEPERA